MSDGMDEVVQLERELEEAIALLKDQSGIRNRIVHKKLLKCLQIVRSLEETNMYDLEEFKKRMEKYLE